MGGALGTHRRGGCLLRLLTGEALSTRRSRLYPRMLILGIETATPQVSVAIGGHEGVIGLFEVLRGRRHAETLTPAIEFVCRQADVDIAEFGAVAVDIGPGLFTGMRVGLASAKAIMVKRPADHFERHEQWLGTQVID